LKPTPKDTLVEHLVELAENMTFRDDGRSRMTGMWKFKSLERVLRKQSSSDVSGVTIIFLEKRLEKFTTEQLSLAMKRGWRREHNSVTFFATSLGDGEGAVIKFDAMFITMQHVDHRLDSSVLGDQNLPIWAAHGAYSSITYACPGGIPVGETRDQFYGFLGLLCAELLSENVIGLLFTEEHVLVRNSAALLQELRSGNSVNPARLAATQVSTSSY
jgi:hypothetical protein